MRVSLAVLATAVVVALPAVAQAGTPLLASDNVTHVRRLPEAAGAISSRFSPDGKAMYVSTVGGMLTYDITKAESPRLKGFLVLPHFENEDVDAGNGVVVLTNDPSFTEFGAIYLIDVHDLANPTLKSVLTTYTPDGMVLGAANTGNGHILNCIQDCKYLWSTGTDEGITVYDIHNLSAPRFMGRFQPPLKGFTHDVFVDRSGIAWVTGEDGTFGYDSTQDPLHPRLIYRSDEAVKNTKGGYPGDDGSGPLDFLHHNAIRTGIQLAKPAPAAMKKKPKKKTKAKSKPKKTKPKNAKPKKARPRTTLGGLGDVVAVTEEDYLKPGCVGQGSLQTWQIRPAEHNSDGTIKLVMLDQWTTELNELWSLRGRSPAAALCSAHWFDESDGLLAQGWYDQGVRFMNIADPRDIKQVGYFISAGTYWGAYFAPTDKTHQTVYALDVAGGIDVLHIDRSLKTAPLRAPVTTRMQKPSLNLKASPIWRFACPLVAVSI